MPKPGVPEVGDDPELFWGAWLHHRFGITPDQMHDMPLTRWLQYFRYAESLISTGPDEQ